MTREEEITDVIGPGKAFKPPFRLAPRRHDALINYAILDDNDTPFCWGLATDSVAQHVCDLLNRAHREKEGVKAWLTRDKGGGIWLYFNHQPDKNEEIGIWDSNVIDYIALDSDQFPSVKWEDQEPTEVEVTIRLKGVEE